MWRLTQSRTEKFKFATTLFSGTDEYAQVTNICAGWPGEYYIAQRVEKREGIAASQKVLSIQAGRRGASDRRMVDDRSRRRTVAVNAIGTGANGDELIVCAAIRLQ